MGDSRWQDFETKIRNLDFFFFNVGNGNLKFISRNAGEKIEKGDGERFALSQVGDAQGACVACGRVWGGASKSAFEIRTGDRYDLGDEGASPNLAPLFLTLPIKNRELEMDLPTLFSTNSGGHFDGSADNS